MASLSYILNLLWENSLSLILFNTSWQIYSIIKESKYATKFLSIKNENQSVPSFYLSSIFITYASSFILGKLLIEKTSLNLGL